MSADARARAVAYVRMSTEHQKYSIANQLAQIGLYASTHRFEIIRVYTDAGKSGLSLSGRDGLQSLINDISSGVPPFRALLLYDVSRLGRFQRPDEAAYYEHLWAMAGISVHYCAETFPNDDSLTAVVMKTVKRAMAAEFSRELSRKVFEAQSHLARRGYRQGGPAGIGYRRAVVDANGRVLRILETGERKTHFAQRLALVKGPEDEVQLVRRIFRLFVCERWSQRRIQKLLRRERPHRRWPLREIRFILQNPKYIGVSVFNRSSQKLLTKSVANSRDRWIVSDNAFEGIVEKELFDAAQAEFATRAPLSDQQLLQQLRELLKEAGALSGEIIRHHPGMATTSTFMKRFGGLQKAYDLIGYTQQSFGELKKMTPEILKSLKNEKQLSTQRKVRTRAK